MLAVTCSASRDQPLMPFAGCRYQSQPKSKQINILLDPSKPYTQPLEDEAATIARQQEFMQWLTHMLLANLYPGAPYERRCAPS